MIYQVVEWAAFLIRAGQSELSKERLSLQLLLGKVELVEHNQLLNFDVQRL